MSPKVHQQIQLVDEVEPYTRVNNALILDKSLKLQTRMVLIIMLSRPPDWDYSVRGTASIAGVSKNTICRAFEELEEAGYIRRSQQRGEGGLFSGYCYEVSSRPRFSPCPQNRDAVGDAEPCPNNRDPDKRDPDNGDELITEYTKTDLSNNPPIVPPKGDGEGGKRKHREGYREAPAWKPERFAAFWAVYPGGGSKQAAIRAWDKLRPSSAMLAEMGRGLQIQMATERWQRGIGIPYASTWLNGHRWTDKLPDTPEAPAAADPSGRVIQPEGVRYL